MTMKHKKHYVDFDDEEGVRVVVEEGGGNEQDQPFDTVICPTPNKDDAEYIAHLLNSK